jgi:predicted amidohydrolase
MIIDPWGRILAEAGTEPGIIVATIDPEQSADARRRIPALANRRPFTAPAADAPRRAVA